MGQYEADKELIPQIEEGYYQAGTLGGGNHFIELQQDDEGMCGIMLHSGSRHFGNIVGQYFNKIAHGLNDKWFSQVPNEWDLPFLPVDTDEGKRYLAWMQLCMDFAYENRAIMLGKIKDIFAKHIEKHTGIVPVFSGEINCHHNYAALENHFGKNVWVHRKGAIRSGEGEMGIIPGSYGFIQLHSPRQRQSRQLHVLVTRRRQSLLAYKGYGHFFSGIRNGRPEEAERSPCKE